MTKKEYYDFSTSMEVLWNNWQSLFPSGTKEFEETLDAWRKITKVIEDYRENNCDFPDWQDENFNK